MVPEDPLVVSISSNSLLHPDELARKTFPRARRGLDAEAVRRYLDLLSADVRELLERDAEVRRRLADAERRAAEPEIDEATLTRAVGSETARILQTAHQAARDVIAAAEARAGQVMEEAEGLAAERSAAADEEAAAIMAGADQEAALLGAASMDEVTALRNSAQLEADELIAAAGNEAAAVLEATKQECRQMVREARELRHRVLNDLGDKRRALRVQLAQLRTGRDSLIEVVDAVGDAVDKVRDRLATAEHEARLAAAQAGERVEQYEHDDDALGERQLRVHLEEARVAAPLPPEEAGVTGTQPEAAGVAATQPEEAGVTGTQPEAAGVAATQPEEARVAAPLPPEEAGVTGTQAEEAGVAPVPPDESLAVETGDDEPLTEPSAEAPDLAAPPAAESDVSAPPDADMDFTAPAEDAGGPADSAAAPGPHRSVGELFARLRGGRGSGGLEPSEPGIPASSEEAASPSEPAIDITDDKGGARVDPVSDVDLGAHALEAPVEATGVFGESSAHEAAVAEVDEDVPPADEPDAAGGDEGTGPNDAELAAAALRRRTELLAPVMTRLARALKRALQDDQNELLDSIRHASAPADLDSLLPAEAHRLRYEQAASLALSDAWTVGRLFVTPDGERDPT